MDVFIDNYDNEPIIRRLISLLALDPEKPEFQYFSEYILKFLDFSVNGIRTSKWELPISDQIQLGQYVEKEKMQKYNEISQQLFSQLMNIILEFLNSGTKEGIVCGINAYLILYNFNQQVTNEIFSSENLLSYFPDLDKDFMILYSKTISNIDLMDEEHLNQILKMAYSEDKDIRNAGCSAIEKLVSKKNEDLTIEIWKNLSSFECENEEIVIDIMETMVDISKNINSEISLALIPDLFKTTTNLFENQPESMIFSKFIGILGNFMKNAGKQIVEYAEDIINFAASIIDDYEEDSLFIFDCIIEIFGEESGNIIEMCADFVIKKLQGNDSIMFTLNLVNLIYSIVKNLNNEEKLIEIWMSIIPFYKGISKGMNSDFKIADKIELILAEIFSKCPERSKELLAQAEISASYHFSGSYNDFKKMAKLFSFQMNYLMYRFINEQNDKVRDEIRRKHLTFGPINDIYFIITSDELNNDEKSAVFNDFLNFSETVRGEKKFIIDRNCFEQFTSSFPDLIERINNTFQALENQND